MFQAEGIVCQAEGIKIEELAGLPESFRSGLAATAESTGLKGKWVVSNTRSAMEPFLTYSTRAYVMQTTNPNMSCGQVINMMRESEREMR